VQKLINLQYEIELKIFQIAYYLLLGFVTDPLASMISKSVFGQFSKAFLFTGAGTD